MSFPFRPYSAGWASPTKKTGYAPDVAATAVKTRADQNIRRTAELHDITVSEGLFHDLDIVHKNPVGRVLYRERARGHAGVRSGGSRGTRIKTHARKGDGTVVLLCRDSHCSRYTCLDTCCGERQHFTRWHLRTPIQKV